MKLNRTDMLYHSTNTRATQREYIYIVRFVYKLYAQKLP